VECVVDILSRFIRLVTVALVGDRVRVGGCDILAREVGPSAPPIVDSWLRLRSAGRDAGIRPLPVGAPLKPLEAASHGTVPANQMPLPLPIRARARARRPGP
jgi:hypothetical protein